MDVAGGPKRPKHCSDCGGKLEERDLYCGSCGGAVAAASPSPAPAARTPPRPGGATSRGGAQAAAREDFDATAFVAALTLGSVWALLNVRRGSLRWGWLCLVGAVPAAVLVWTWLSTVLRTFGTPYYVLFDRSTLQGAALLAFLLRLALTVPMALDAGRSERFWTPQQALLRKLGLAGASAVLLGLGLDRATLGARRGAALADVRARTSVVVFYLGRERRDPKVGHWTVGVQGPEVGFALSQPMELVVRDEAFPSGRNVAAASESLDSSRPNRGYYAGPTDLSFKEVGAHPRYALTIGGQEMRSGDLQAESTP